MFRAGLAAVDPESLIRERVRVGKGVLEADGVSLALDDFQRVAVLAAGKAAGSMCRAVEELLADRLGDRFAGGLAVTKYGHGPVPERIELLEAGHPVPDENGVAAARRMLELARGLGPKDLALVLLSGGGSALLPCPADPSLTLGHKQEATRLLLACGADIHEINTVRKHLSAIKGGGLLRALAPAACLTLALSDVMADVMADDVGEAAATIASGPTAPDPTTHAQALDILERRGVSGRMPGPVLDWLRQGAAKERPETLKPGDPALERAHWVLLGDNQTALNGAADKARALGWEVVLLDRPLLGEARQEGRALAEAVRGLRLGRAGRAGRPICLLAGGESVVTLRGNGRGGRNQEMALAFLRAMAQDEQLSGVTFLAASTDGTDGPTDAAGAFADRALLELPGVDAQSMDLALDNNDSHTFFNRFHGLLRTGPTGTNVCDLALALIP